MENEKMLIDAINKEMPRLPDTNYKLGYSHGLNKAKDIVLKLDSVEVVHAKWIDAYGIRKSKCENCGVAFGRVMDGDCHYCPNCGAKMDGGNEDVPKAD